MSATQEQTIVEVTVDEDRMRAWLHRVKDADLAAITKDQIEAALQSIGIPLTDDVAVRIEDCLASQTSDAALPEKILIAEGRGPEVPRDGKFEWTPETMTPSEGGQDAAEMGLRRSDAPRRVRKGDVIGKVFPPTKAAPGIDVFGEPIEPKRRASAIEIGPNVKLLDDGNVVSETFGKAVFQNEQVRVEEILEVTGDVDLECGNLDTPNEIHIRGTIHDALEVKSKQAITIEGNVRAARVEAGADLVVCKGIIGGNKGAASATGRIAARFCEEADLRATGDIHIASGTVNSELATDGKVLAEEAKIVGGSVNARKGVVVSVLGNDAEAPTLVRVGFLAGLEKTSSKDLSNEMIADLRAEKLASDSDEIARSMKDIGSIRQHLRLAIDEPDKISETVRQRAATLLAQADQIEAGIKHKTDINEKLSKTGELMGTAEIIILKEAYPKVTLMVDDRQTRLIKPLKGPVRIEKRKLKNVSELIAVNLRTGSYTRLQSERLSQ